MFEKLLNSKELTELKNMVKELNRLMESCSIGSGDACALANIQYKKILLWKKNKMTEKLKETYMENSNLSFSTQPLTTGKFIQTPKAPTFFQLVNSIGDCNYSKPLTGQNTIPFEGQFNMRTNFVGAAPQIADDAAREIAAMLAKFDVEQEETVSGIRTVGKSWWQKVTEKIKIPTMQDIKREVTQAVDPVHMAQQLKNAVQTNLDELKDWGKRILKNPAELLHPPLPKTGNKTIDEDIIKKIEDMARKVDPAWQIGDLVEKHVIDPAIEKFKEGTKKEGSSNAVASAAEVIIGDLRRKLDEILINNPFITTIEANNYRENFAKETEVERQNYATQKRTDKIAEDAKKAGLSISEALELELKSHFLGFFEKVAGTMMRAAGLSNGSWEDPTVFDKWNQEISNLPGQQGLFEDLFSMVKNKKNRGIFEGSCGPDSKQIGSKNIDGKNYLVCQLTNPAPKIVWKTKYVRVHGIRRGVVGAVYSDVINRFSRLITFLNKLKMVQSKPGASNLLNSFKDVLSKLQSNYGLFEGGCGIHSTQKGSFTIGDTTYALCEVTPGIVQTKIKTRKVLAKRTRGVSGCPSCMIEELTLGRNNPSNYSNFYKLAGIRHFSGNTMEGKRFSKF